eukprot:7942436-Pyramimonas_sp.AAC.1
MQLHACSVALKRIASGCKQFASKGALVILWGGWGVEATHNAVACAFGCVETQRCTNITSGCAL